MKTPLLLQLIAAIILSIQVSFAQVNTLLTDTANVKTKINFSENYIEKIVTINYYGATKKEVVGKASASFNISGNMTGVDVFQIDEFSEISFSIGGMSASTTFEDTVVKGSSATLTIVAERYNAEGDFIGWKKIGKATLKWNVKNSTFTMKLNVTDLSLAEMESIIPLDHANDGDQGSPIGGKTTFDVPVNVSIKIGNNTGSATMIARSNAKTVYRKIGKGADASYMAIHSMMIKGVKPAN